MIHYHPCEVCKEPTPCKENCREDEFQAVVWCKKHTRKRKKKKDIMVNLKKAYAV
jgi:hypothetical protein